MEKPLRSCGGRDVRRFKFRTAESKDNSAEQAAEQAVYWQEAIDGVPCSGAFVAAAGQATVLGATRQLVGERWLGASGFQYCGSVGPLTLDDRRRRTLLRIGQCLASQFQLRGLFGVDFILTETNLVPIEVNPRYTASLEVLERALGVRSMEHHQLACRDGRLASVAPARNFPSSCWGKAIVFADEDTVIRHDLRADFESDSWPRVADVPAADSNIQCGHPIATVFASGVNEVDVLANLREQAQVLRSRLGANRSPLPTPPSGL